MGFFAAFVTAAAVPATPFLDCNLRTDTNFSWAGFPSLNVLKKRLISNLVLESVLDKALDDFLPAINNSEVKAEDDKEGVKNDLNEEKKTVQENLEEVIKKEIKNEMEAEEREAKMNRKRQAGLRKRKVSEKRDVLEKVVEVNDIKEEGRRQNFRRWLQNLKWHYYWQLWGGFFYIVEKSSDKDENCEKLKLEVS